MPDSNPDQISPRARLLEAADRLFYEEGICSVGVDRILKEAGVARASLYTAYGSKDKLVSAYLYERSARWQAMVAETLPVRWSTPRDRILGVFELLTEWFAAPGYRGCPFINASAEMAASDAIIDVRDRHRAWVRGLFAELGRAAGAEYPNAVSEQLVLLYDGSMVGAQLDHSVVPGVAAGGAARAVLDAAINGRA
jgi:AcrR family transcriptional regulator